MSSLIPVRDRAVKPRLFSDPPARFRSGSARKRAVEPRCPDWPSVPFLQQHVPACSRNQGHWVSPPGQGLPAVPGLAVIILECLDVSRIRAYHPRPGHARLAAQGSAPGAPSSHRTSDPQGRTESAINRPSRFLWTCMQTGSRHSTNPRPQDSSAISPGTHPGWPDRTFDRIGPDRLVRRQEVLSFATRASPIRSVPVEKPRSPPGLELRAHKAEPVAGLAQLDSRAQNRLSSLPTELDPVREQDHGPRASPRARISALPLAR